MKQPTEKSLYAYLAAFRDARPDAMFLRDERRSYSVREVFDEVTALANDLWDCGVREGNLVAFRVSRSLDACMLFYALLSVGAVAVLCDPHGDAEEFLRESGIAMQPDFVLCDRGNTGHARNGEWILKKESTQFPIDVAYPARTAARRFVPVENLMGPSAVVLTSGTTGKSKGVVLSQSGILCISIATAPLGWYLHEDIAAAAVPLYHVFGVSLIVTAVVTQHAIFFPERVDVPYLLECVERYRCTRMNGVPTFYLAMAHENERLHHDVSSLRTGLIGGAPVTVEQFRYIEKTLGMTLVPIYGMSESIAMACASWQDSEIVRATTNGRFYSMSTGYILRDDGSELPAGEEGEVCVSGPSVMLGYFGDEEGTRAVIDEKGRLHTGDLGYLDQDGYLHITGRKKDIIIRNGNNLSARKIEEALISLPQVQNAVVVSVSHSRFGEVPGALVVCERGYAPDAAAIRASLGSVLVKNEIPEVILFADEIPLTASGKADKQSVKELFREWKA